MKKSHTAINVVLSALFAYFSTKDIVGDPTVVKTFAFVSFLVFMKVNETIDILFLKSDDDDKTKNDNSGSGTGTKETQNRGAVHQASA